MSVTLIQFFIYLNAKLMFVTQRWAEVLTLPLPAAYLCLVRNLSLPFTPTHLFIWHIGVSGQTCNVELKLEF
jgi:hypothetical protein